MILQEAYPQMAPSIIYSKLKDCAALVKLRLASLVVFSAAMGLLMAPASIFSWSKFVFLIVGGFFVTGSSNAFNQIIEKDLDKLMNRTQDRPLPSGRMSSTEALVLAAFTGFLGIAILYIFINPLSALLGSLALGLYTLVYTPLKRVTPFAVFVGAFPGAIPPMLGWVAATNHLDITAWILFSIQFIWQFPHFWAIAWVLDEDYKKAGFKMLPSVGGRNKSSAFQTMIYALSLIPLSFVPHYFNMIGLYSTLIICCCSIVFFVQALGLYQRCDIPAARKLMFGSFIYLPVVQIALVLGKIHI
jgi:protoheme IX farnesyltransferase